MSPSPSPSPSPSASDAGAIIDVSDPIAVSFSIDLVGGTGNDTLTSGASDMCSRAVVRDTLTGGAGTNVFKFGALDFSAQMVRS